MLTTMIALASTDINCGEVYGRLNNRKPVTQQEIQVCREDLMKNLSYDFSVQKKALKENKGYCQEKFNREINYRRNETVVESAVCGEVFKEERKKEKEAKMTTRFF